MKTEKAVLWQLFGSIAVGIFTGILIGYRTNVWLGILAGTTFTFFTADWKHVKATAKEYRARGLKAWRQSNMRPVLATGGEVLFLFVLIFGSGFVGCVTLSVLMIWTQPGFALKELQAFLNGNPIDGAAVVGFVYSIVLAFIAFVGCAILQGTVRNKRLRRYPLTRFPLLRGIGMVFSREKKSKPVPASNTQPREETIDFEAFFRLCYKDAQGRHLSKGRLTGLGIVIIALAGLWLWLPLLALGAVLVLTLALIDACITLFIALANSRNTIAGICTAVGIGVWFLLYPTQPSSALEWMRLVGFAVCGGAIGVGLYRLRQYLLSIPLPGQVMPEIQNVGT